MFPFPNENGTLSVHRILLSVMSVRMYFTTDTSVRSRKNPADWFTGKKKCLQIVLRTVCTKNRRIPKLAMRRDKLWRRREDAPAF